MNIVRPAVQATSLFILSLALLACSPEPDQAETTAPPVPTVSADFIFGGGTIVTMDSAMSAAESIAVKDGKIIAVGSGAETSRFRGPETEQVDLAGGTLLPGFIDAHSHFSQAVASANWANVSGAPVGKVASIADLIAGMQAQKNSNQATSGDWLVGYGYDADTLSDGRGLTRDDLDAAFPDNPVIIIHVSFHGAVLNSKAFAAINYDETTPTPEGGVIVRRQGSNEPLGLVMETAWFPAVASIPQPAGEEVFENIRKAQQFYASFGVTTVQDGFVGLAEFQGLKAAAEHGDLYLDTIVLGSFAELQEYAVENATYKDYSGHLKLGGIKVVSDGSPQGKTAFFTQPYLTGGPGGETDWRGEPVVPAEQLEPLLGAIYSSGLQAYVHANADAAVDMLLSAHQTHLETAGEDSRTVIIHSQFIRPDQLEAYARFGMVPAFFSNHAFFWGDVHVENLGVERAHFLSPMQSASKLGIRFTNHSDYMVTPLDPLFTVWSAVNRVSRSGAVIGEQERISVAQALKAITIDGAYQYFEEAQKGSIEVGKLADLVVLDANPLTVDPMSIKDIKVVSTYKEGRQVYPLTEM